MVDVCEVERRFTDDWWLARVYRSAEGREFRTAVPRRTVRDVNGGIEAISYADDDDMLASMGARKERS